GDVESAAGAGQIRLHERDAGRGVVGKQDAGAKTLMAVHSVGSLGGGRRGVGTRLGTLRGSGGKGGGEVKRAAGALLGLHPESPAHQFDDVFGDGQAEARAAVLSRGGG